MLHRMIKKKGFGVATTQMQTPRSTQKRDGLSSRTATSTCGEKTHRVECVNTCVRVRFNEKKKKKETIASSPRLVCTSWSRNGGVGKNMWGVMVFCCRPKTEWGRRVSSQRKTEPTVTLSTRSLVPQNVRQKVGAPQTLLSYDHSRTSPTRGTDEFFYLRHATTTVGKCHLNGEGTSCSHHGKFKLCLTTKAVGPTHIAPQALFIKRAAPPRTFNLQYHSSSHDQGRKTHSRCASGTFHTKRGSSTHLQLPIPQWQVVPNGQHVLPKFVAQQLSVVGTFIMATPAPWSDTCWPCSGPQCQRLTGHIKAPRPFALNLHRTSDARQTQSMCVWRYPSRIHCCISPVMCFMCRLSFVIERVNVCGVCCQLLCGVACVRECECSWLFICVCGSLLCAFGCPACPRRLYLEAFFLSAWSCVAVVVVPMAHVPELVCFCLAVCACSTFSAGPSRWRSEGSAPHSGKRNALSRQVERTHQMVLFKTSDSAMLSAMCFGTSRICMVSCVCDAKTVPRNPFRRCW